MPTLKSADLQMHYLLDDFTDPWTQPETILLLHGNCQSSAAWVGGVPPEGVKYWIDFMSRTAVSSMIGFQAINYVDIGAEMPNIKCPTLVITTEGSGLASVEENRAWQQQIPNSKLLVLPGNSYHVA